MGGYAPRAREDSVRPDLAEPFWWTQFRDYIVDYRLGKARKFLQRFEAWRVMDYDRYEEGSEESPPARR